MELESKTLIYWCDNCKIPIIKESNKTFHKCPTCNSWIKYLSKDIRPVFPEERLLFELITSKAPNSLIKNSVWCNKSTYYIDGLSEKLNNDIFINLDIKEIRESLNKYSCKNSYKYFNKYIELFIKSNKKHFNMIKTEATSFIIDTYKLHPNLPKYISFSGGKDSTVTANLVTNALGNPSILHLFCNTTLEYPFTLEYIERLRKDKPMMLLKTIKNKEHNFYEVCDDIGVPSTCKRWCCTIFKTGVTSKFFTNFFNGTDVIMFSGLRNCESNTRKNYRRIESESKKRKIQNQTIVSPILNWNDIDVWLYILSERIDFNYAYRLGFNRVGCWCCPNTSPRGDTLAKIYMPKEASKWYKYLLEYAKRIGKENPKNYIDSGNWKLIRGGEGLISSNDIKINKQLCTLDEHAEIYKLNKEINNHFYNLFVPFGTVSMELGKKVLNEVLVLKNTVPIISIQPKDDNLVKIKTMNIKNHEELRMRIRYQILKFNACRKCFKCEGICKVGAITIRNGSYKIDSEKCIHCLSCVNTKYISDGCIMKSYLKTRSK